MSFIQHWRQIRPAWLLAGAIIIGWIIGVIGDGINVCPQSILSSCETSTFYLAQYNGIVLYYHQFYQLFTSIFVTDDPLDAGFNAIAVIILDRLSDDAFDKTRYFLVFLLTALVGNLVTLAQGVNYVSAGASGGIFGVFAATLSYAWTRDRKIETSTLVFFVVVFVGSSFFIPNVNWVAHLGGAAAGFVLGPVLYNRSSRPESEILLPEESSQLAKLTMAIAVSVILVLSAIQFAVFVAV